MCLNLFSSIIFIFSDLQQGFLQIVFCSWKRGGILTEKGKIIPVPRTVEWRQISRYCYPWETASSITWIRGWTGPRAGLDTVAKKKIKIKLMKWFLK
jgi:hypothetical protein